MNPLATVIRILLLYIFTLSISTGFAQRFSALDPYTQKLHSIDPSETDFSDLELLGEQLKNKQLVLLGEQEHGDGSAFSAKIRVIKFLHQKLGFDVIAFETGFYSTQYYWNAYQQGKITCTEATDRSMLKQWASAEEMQPLFQYIADSSLVLTGFDNYDHDPPLLDGYKKILDSLERAHGISHDNVFDRVLTQLATKGMYANPSVAEKESFYKHIDLLINALQKEGTNAQQSFWVQELTGLRAQGMGWWQPNAHTRENRWSSQNIRDKQMADNILWLLKTKYPGRKIIVWAANYHIARNVSTQVNKDKYFQNTGAVSMGEYLYQQLGDELYALGVCSYAGTRAATDHVPFETYNIKPRSKETLEYYLHSKGYAYAFTNFTPARTVISPFRMAGLFHYELTGNWTHVFDGMIFIDSMKAPSYR